MSDLIVSEGEFDGNAVPAYEDSTYYTSLTEIQRLFSVDGVNYRRDDFDELDEGYNLSVNEIILQAHYKVKSIINKVFSDANALLHPFIRAKATYIGAYYLSIRRGNDSHYFNQYLEAIEELQALVDGELFLDDLPNNFNSLITFCNVSSDNRYAFSPMRVDPLTSVPDVRGATFLQRYIPFSWL